MREVLWTDVCVKFMIISPSPSHWFASHCNHCRGTNDNFVPYTFDWFILILYLLSCWWRRDGVALLIWYDCNTFSVLNSSLVHSSTQVVWKYLIVQNFRSLWLAAWWIRCQVWIQYTVMRGAGQCEALFVAHIRCLKWYMYLRTRYAWMDWTDCCRDRLASCAEFF